MMYAEKEQTLESLLIQMKTEKSSDQNWDYFMDYEERSINIVENPYSPLWCNELWCNSKKTMKHRTSEYFSMRDFNLDLGIVDDSNTSVSNTNISFYLTQSNQVRDVTCPLTCKQSHAIVSDKSMQLISGKTVSNIHDAAFQSQSPGISFYNSNNAISNEAYNCKDPKYWCNNPYIHATDHSHCSPSPSTTQGSKPECNTGATGGLLNNTTAVPLSHALVHDLNRAISSLSTLTNKASQLEKVATFTHHYASETSFSKKRDNSEKNQGFPPEQPLSSSFKLAEYQICEDDPGRKNYTGKPKIHTYPVPAYELGKVVHNDLKYTGLSLRP